MSAQRLSEAIANDAILSGQSINWTEWSHFIHQPFFCPETDVFDYEKRMLVGILKCKATRIEKARALYEIISTEDQI